MPIRHTSRLTLLSVNDNAKYFLFREKRLIIHTDENTRNQLREEKFFYVVYHLKNEEGKHSFALHSEQEYM